MAQAWLPISWSLAVAGLFYSMYSLWLLHLQVTLFKRNYAHVVSEAYFKSYHTVARGNPNYFITYGNGKSAARVRAGLRPNGAHRWYNYFRAPM